MKSSRDEIRYDCAGVALSQSDALTNGIEYMGWTALSGSKQQDNHGTVPSRESCQGTTKTCRNGLVQNGHTLHRIARRQPCNGHWQSQTKRRPILKKAHDERTQQVGWQVGKNNASLFCRTATMCHTQRRTGLEPSNRIGFLAVFAKHLRNEHAQQSPKDGKQTNVNTLHEIFTFRVATTTRTGGRKYIQFFSLQGKCCI